VGVVVVGIEIKRNNITTVGPRNVSNPGPGLITCTKDTQANMVDGLVHYYSPNGNTIVEYNAPALIGTIFQNNFVSTMYSCATLGSGQLGVTFACDVFTVCINQTSNCIFGNIYNWVNQGTVFTCPSTVANISTCLMPSTTTPSTYYISIGCKGVSSFSLIFSLFILYLIY